MNKELKATYDAGYDCEKNGANTINCHYSIFSSKEKMEAWEKGKRDAKETP
jgi:hypothetical protein